MNLDSIISIAFVAEESDPSFGGYQASPFTYYAPLISS